ncbi:MAG: 4Fe-4S binding protein [Planctomycetes bacterium]|nr:4Fe-4S binding protein [Planctomycetota bacterium]
MRYFLDAFGSLKTSFTNLMRRPTTVQFPTEKRVRAERYRSSFALLHDEAGDELCIGCLQCERICPSQVIAIKAAGKKESPVTGKKRGYADDFILDLNACIYCELCVQVCPTDAIVMTREPEVPAYGREDLVLTMAKLYANEKSKPRAWSDGTKLMEMQEKNKPADAPKKPHAAHAEKPAAEAKPVVDSKTATDNAPRIESKPADAPTAANAGSISISEAAKPADPASGGAPSA